MMDMTGNLKPQNRTLQGRGGSALYVLEEVFAFERKLIVLDVQMYKYTMIQMYKEPHVLICHL